MAIRIGKKPDLLKGYHWHHLLPKHKGGDDSKNNLVLLSPLDHAIAHYVRYKLEKKQADAWAFNRLMNQAKCDGIRIGNIKPNLGKKFTAETNKKKGRSGILNAMKNEEVKQLHKNIMQDLSGKGIFSNFGKNNPSSKQVKINNMTFDCINSASQHFKVGRDTIRNWLGGARPKKHQIWQAVFVDGGK